MKTRRYIFYALVYLALIWVLVFSLTNVEGGIRTHTVSFLGYELNLAVATWVILPIALFALLSLFHIAYYGMRNFFDARALKSDMSLYDSLAKEIYLGTESNKEFKTDLFSTAAEVTKSLSPWLQLEPDFRNEELKNAYEIAKKVRGGEACDLKRYKLLKTNPLFLQNEKNKIDNDYKYALSIKDNDDEGLKAYARAAILKNCTWLEISKFDSNLSNEEIKSLVYRKLNNDDFELSSADFMELLEKADFDAEEYTKIAISLKEKNKFAPDQIMSMFEKLKNSRSSAMEAYLYVLYDLQMLEKLREALINENGDEFEKIKTLLFLRDNGKRASADLFYK